MRKFASHGLAVLIAVLAVATFAGPADAAGPKVKVSLDRSVLKSGQTFKVTARANVRCQWLVQWAGERRVQVGRTFTGVFTAPTVSRQQRYPVRATCYYATKRPNAHRPPVRGTAERITVF